MASGDLTHASRCRTAPPTETADRPATADGTRPLCHRGPYDPLHDNPPPPSRERPPGAPAPLSCRRRTSPQPGHRDRGRPRRRLAVPTGQRGRVGGTESTRCVHRTAAHRQRAGPPGPPGLTGRRPRSPRSALGAVTRKGGGRERPRGRRAREGTEGGSTPASARSAKPRGQRLTAPERRESILRAATEVFSETGYLRGRTSLIAARAGVSEPVVFNNFGTKPALPVRGRTGTRRGDRLPLPARSGP